MWSRGRFDLSWSDLAFAALRCARPGDRERLERRVERLWSPTGDALACASVRSGFELLLRSLQLPAGSEVLLSALNVKGMVRVVERLGLVAVPVDLDLDHLAPRPDALERALGPRSRVLVVAHLFGARVELGPVLGIARRHGLFVVEDCAQAFDGCDTGHPQVDASLFSFGPLKTATALGGALVRVPDPELRERMAGDLARYPVQSRSAYLAHLVRFAAIKSLTYRGAASVLFRLSRLARADLDRQLELAARRLTREKDPSRPGRRSQKLQQRPSAPLLALLERRLRRAPEPGLQARARAGRALLERISDTVVCPGSRNPRHVFWLFPVLTKRPGTLIAALRAEGFDAAPAVSLRAVPTPRDRPHLEPVAAHEVLAQLVILPCYGALGWRDIERQAATVLRVESGREPAVDRGGAGLADRLWRTRRR